MCDNLDRVPVDDASPRWRSHPSEWVIVAVNTVGDEDEPLFWSNEDGWVHLLAATRFEDTNFNLPIGGQWVERNTAFDLLPIPF